MLVEYEPVSHDRQTSDEAADNVDEYVPATQFVQIVELLSDHDPATQFRHVLEPDVDHEPASQTTHKFVPAPGRVEY